MYHNNSFQGPSQRICCNSKSGRSAFVDGAADCRPPNEGQTLTRQNYGCDLHVHHSSLDGCLQKAWMEQQGRARDDGQGARDAGQTVTDSADLPESLQNTRELVHRVREMLVSSPRLEPAFHLEGIDVPPDLMTAERFISRIAPDQFLQDLIRSTTDSARSSHQKIREGDSDRVLRTAMSACSLQRARLMSGEQGRRRFSRHHQKRGAMAIPPPPGAPGANMGSNPSALLLEAPTIRFDQFHAVLCSTAAPTRVVADRDSEDAHSQSPLFKPSSSSRFSWSDAAVRSNSNPRSSNLSAQSFGPVISCSARPKSSLTEGLKRFHNTPSDRTH